MCEETGLVGAFWVLDGPRVIGERCALSEAERVGDVLNGPTAHNSLWLHLAKPASLLGRVYTTVPRGRVLYREGISCFTVLAAPEILRDAKARHAVQAFFGLGEADRRVQWQADPHYVTQPDLIDEGDVWEDQ